MTTIHYSEAVQTEHDTLHGIWADLTPEQQAKIPEPVLNIPDDLAGVVVTFPDEWVMSDIDKFYQGSQAAPVGSSPGNIELYGTIALCDAISGIEIADLGKLPLHYGGFFNWLRQTVYIDSYLQAVEPPKN